MTDSNHYYDINIVFAGVDEVGRGPLAGPVTAAAVILDPQQPVIGLDDSKRLSESKRQLLAEEIQKKSTAWAICNATVEEIDRLNILQASLLAMSRAISSLNVKPALILVDGNHCPNINIKVQAIVGGDRKIPAISAASIIAKVTRDKEMVKFDKVYPGYGFARNKGYPTKEHIQALRMLGASPIHRQSFSPVRQFHTR